jgi:hypothetical protein
MVDFEIRLGQFCAPDHRYPIEIMAPMRDLAGPGND